MLLSVVFGYVAELRGKRNSEEEGSNRLALSSVSARYG